MIPASECITPSAIHTITYALPINIWTVKIEVVTYLSLVAYTNFVNSDIRHTDTHGKLASRQCSRFNCQRIDSGYLLISGGEVRESQTIPVSASAHKNDLPQGSMDGQ